MNLRVCPIVACSVGFLAACSATTDATDIAPDIELPSADSSLSPSYTVVSASCGAKVAKVKCGSDSLYHAQCLAKAREYAVQTTRFDPKTQKVIPGTPFACPPLVDYGSCPSQAECSSWCKSCGWSSGQLWSSGGERFYAIDVRCNCY